LAARSSAIERSSVGLDFVWQRGRISPRRRPWVRVLTFAHDLPALCIDDEVRTRVRRRPTPTLFVHVPGVVRGVWYW
jgi:hypothetical protein